MNGIAFLFPGQGSQEVGMGFDIYNSLPWAKEYFEAAQNLLGNSWLEIIFNGNIEDLSKTENTQPAMLLVSTVLSEALKKKGILPQAAAGHSVGEYAAYVASGILDFPSALKIIRKRAEFMSNAVPEGYGNMAAILGLDDKLVENACERASKLGIVQPANYNCPGQVVISGQRSAVIQAGLYAQEFGAKKIIELKVSGPFHCSLMRDASDKLHKEIKNVTFKTPLCKYISNVTAKSASDPEEIQELLIQQIINPVRWTNSIQNLINDGYNTFIEIGPGRVLSGLMKRINKNAKCFNVDNLETIDKTIKELLLMGYKTKEDI